MARKAAAIRELLTKLNYRPFRRGDGSRVTAFASIDKPALKLTAYGAVRPFTAQHRSGICRKMRRNRKRLKIADEGHGARADGSLRSLLAKLSRLEVLVIDD